ncbi:Nramp family divalent metal transporter [Winogradskya consettensis]|uniref:Divalent metal cation transporter MntH n=1 Tax=Winogradskya consettensis TaxID=113560 RepID=A0A919SZ40_9ACTN|nr:Nramp family divalent metal transporter [Actinoplanes consettensis]GIM79838.1 divalent metal cation transporter MntH [Actinoplanes consettensis]
MTARRLALFGPALVAAIAYVDPGNIAANTQAGAQTGYALVWVIVLASLIALLVQYLSAKLGLATGRSLPELCAAELPRRTNIAMWIQAEAIAICTDVAEFVGAALGLNLLFGTPLPIAGIITAVASLALLHLHRFQGAVAALLVLTAGGFLYDTIALDDITWPAMGAGLAPTLPDATAVTLAAGIVGATVMPHAVYLHSALTTTHPAADRQHLLRSLKLDCLTGLGLASLVNLALLVLAAELYATHPDGAETIQGAHTLIQGSVGAPAAVIFAGSLLTSGLASSSVGTFAGEVVMAGFIQRRIPATTRRLITMLPSLVVLCTGIPITATLVASQAVLSFGVPFALVPLVLFTRRRRLMGPLVNRRLTTLVAAVACALVIALNIGLLVTLFL